MNIILRMHANAKLIFKQGADVDDDCRKKRMVS